MAFFLNYQWAPGKESTGILKKKMKKGERGGRERDPVPVEEGIAKGKRKRRAKTYYHRKKGGKDTQEIPHTFYPRRKK